MESRMAIGSLLVILAIILVSGAFIARPLLEEQVGEISASERRLSVLEAEKDRVLIALRETEMDHDMGKLNAEDYQAQRQEWMDKGVSILKQIDALRADAQEKEETLVDPQPETSESLIEDELEAAVARLREAKASGAVGFCTQCGQEILQGDHFCTRCGKAVSDEGKAE